MATPITSTVRLSDRLAALTPRERLFLGVGAVTLLLFLLWLFVWREADGDSPVELADAPPPPAVTSPTTSPVAIQPIPIQPPPTLPVVTAPTASAAAVPSLLLQGVSGGGPGGGAALIQYQNGAQRLVRVGREIVPGMVLKHVGLTWAIANSGGSELRLDLNRPGAIPVAAPPLASAPQSRDRAEQSETLDLRLGLEPVKAGGRVRGYRVRSGASLPRLSQAGLQPGDVITGVNGSVLDEERLLELSWQMSNSQQTELNVIRAGKPLKLILAPTK